MYILQATRTTEQIIVTCSLTPLICACASLATLLQIRLHHIMFSVTTCIHICTRTQICPKSICACKLLRQEQRCKGYKKKTLSTTRRIASITRKTYIEQLQCVSFQAFWLFYLLLFVVVMYLYKKKERIRKRRTFL